MLSTRRQLRRLVLSGLALNMLASTGCGHLGVRSIERDRLGYSLALSESIKAQALINLVRLRYIDAPVFLDVSQIVSSDSMETSASLAGVYRVFGIQNWDSVTLNGGAKFTQRPTVTFSPLTGDKFMRAMMEPIQPAQILSLVESGYDAHFVLETCVSAINGLHNRSIVAQRARPADESFVRLMAVISQVQAEGAIGFRLERAGKAEPVCVTVFRRPQGNPEVESAAREVKALLGLDAEQERFVVVRGDVAGPAGQLTMQTRSMLQVMASLSSYIEVPPEDVASGRAMAAPPVPATGTAMFRVFSGSKRPADAFCAVRYRERWFWVDDRDWSSKRTLSFVMFLFTLASAGTDPSLPVLTIPAG